MKIKITDETPSAGNFMSWKRLASEVFKASGELARDEHVAYYEVDERGITYYVVRK